MIGASGGRQLELNTEDWRLGLETEGWEPELKTEDWNCWGLEQGTES